MLSYIGEQIPHRVTSDRAGIKELLQSYLHLVALNERVLHKIKRCVVVDWMQETAVLVKL